MEKEGDLITGGILQLYFNRISNLRLANVECERIQDVEDVLAEKKIGRRYVLPWIKEKTEILCVETGLNVTQKAWEIQRVKHKDSTAIYIVGVKETENFQAIGFIAFMINDKVESVSCFADLENEFRWIRRRGSKEKTHRIRKE